MDDTRITKASNDQEIMLNGFGPEEAKKLKDLVVRFLREYGKKAPEMSDEEWL